MATEYCPVSECGTCAGIGEVLTDTGIKTCMTCRGQGHRLCPADELRIEVRLLQKLRAHAVDPMPVIGLALALSGLSVLLVIIHMVFGAR